MKKNTSPRVTCPNCLQQNTIRKNQILNLTSSPKCRGCKEDLLPFVKKPLINISNEAFVHTLDRQMLDTLIKVPGISTVLKTLLSQSFELSMRLHHQGNFIKANKKQLKSLHIKLAYAAEALDISTVPELYVYQDPRANAYTFGVKKHAIAVSSGLIEIMNDEEIICVLAHELGHIKANHVLYKTASRLLSSIASNIAKVTFGLGNMFLYPLYVSLLRWDRASELSSDRAALLVVKNPKVLLNTLMKLACGSHILQKELDINSFIEQANSYEKTQDEGPLGKYIAVMDSIFASHPFPIWRAKEILNWVYNGEFFDILAGYYHQNNVLKKTDKDEDNNRQGEKSSYDPIDKTIGSIKSWYKKNFDLNDNG